MKLLSGSFHTTNLTPCRFIIMKNVLSVLLIVFFLSSCNNEQKGPDMSAIKVDVQLRRFDEAFFKLDTNNLQQSLTQLQSQYPQFLPLFVSNVVGLGPMVDSNQLIFPGIKKFLQLNKTVYDTSVIVHGNLQQFKEEMEDGFRHLKYYYPAYSIPQLIATIGPMDALAPLTNQTLTPNYMGTDFIAVGLQFYLGSEFSIYNDPGYISSIAPQYRSKRFSKEYMTAEVFSLIIDDMYPDSSNRLPLIERFVEKGKRMYLLQKFLPNKADSILTGYTKAQLNWCTENERSIFNFFTQNNLLYERDPGLIQNFVNEGPFTQGMSEQSPGNIGLFTGWEIVKAYVKKKGNIQPDVLMKTPAKKIFEESAYRPR
jgi:hypothetical protein